VRESEWVQAAAVVSISVRTTRRGTASPGRVYWVKFYAFFYKEKIKHSGVLIGSAVLGSQRPFHNLPEIWSMRARSLPIPAGGLLR